METKNDRTFYDLISSCEYNGVSVYFVGSDETTKSITIDSRVLIVTYEEFIDLFSVIKHQRTFLIIEVHASNYDIMYRVDFTPLTITQIPYDCDMYLYFPTTNKETQMKSISTPVAPEYTIKMLDCSTAHITQNDMERLCASDQSDSPLTFTPACAGGGYGCILYVSDSIDHSYSKALFDVVEYAEKNGYKFIHFNPDATLNDNFVTFNW